jgi:hypothetical protein
MPVSMDPAEAHAGPATPIIESRVVRDAKQSALDIRYRPVPKTGFECLDRDLLDDVVGVDGGAGHACAIAMQLQPQLAKETVKRLAIFDT